MPQAFLLLSCPLLSEISCLSSITQPPASKFATCFASVAKKGCPLAILSPAAFPPLAPPEDGEPEAGLYGAAAGFLLISKALASSILKLLVCCCAGCGTVGDVLLTGDGPFEAARSCCLESQMLRGGGLLVSWGFGCCAGGCVGLEVWVGEATALERLLLL